MFRHIVQCALSIHRIERGVIIFGSLVLPLIRRVIGISIVYRLYRIEE